MAAVIDMAEAKAALIERRLLRAVAAECGPSAAAELAETAKRVGMRAHEIVTRESIKHYGVDVWGVA